MNRFLIPSAFRPFQAAMVCGLALSPLGLPGLIAPASAEEAAPAAGGHKHQPLRPPARPAPFSLHTAEPVVLPEGRIAEQPAFEEHFGPGWDTAKGVWEVATWKQNATLMAKDRSRTDGQGKLVQTVLPELPGKGGSVQTGREFGWGRWVARVRPSPVPGVLNSIFTKDWDNLKTASPRNDGGKSEVDIEFLTRTFGNGKGEVHLAIHLDGYSPYWEEDVPLDFNPADDFHDWGFDILPDRVIWHVDGRKLGEWIYEGTFRIDPEYEFFFNAWTMAKWIKGPPPERADYHVDWVKFYPYAK